MKGGFENHPYDVGKEAKIVQGKEFLGKQVKDNSEFLTRTEEFIIIE